MAARAGHIEHNPMNAAAVLAITGPGELTGRRMQRLIVIDGQCRRINGRYIVGNVLVPGPDGRPLVDHESGSLVTRRHRFRIPRGHQWRGKRP